MGTANSSEETQSRARNLVSQFKDRQIEIEVEMEIYRYNGVTLFPFRLRSGAPLSASSLEAVADALPLFASVVYADNWQGSNSVEYGLQTHSLTHTLSHTHTRTHTNFDTTVTLTIAPRRITIQ